jgi:hypothetical protein
MRSQLYPEWRAICLKTTNISVPRPFAGADGLQDVLSAHGPFADPDRIGDGCRTSIARTVGLTWIKLVLRDGLLRSAKELPLRDFRP